MSIAFEYIVGSVKRIMKKSPPLSLVLTDYILPTETPSRLNLTGFQPGLDWVADIKFWSLKPKKGEVKAFNFWNH